MFKSKAVSLGADGNKKAEAGDYYSAIESFSKAVELYPYDYRYYLNRAFCYERTELYHLALADAEAAIDLRADIEKAHFRKGRALMGLREYTKAEQTFEHVLDMNPQCLETKSQLIELRCTALIDIGFDKDTAQKAAKYYNSIREAIDALLSQNVSIDQFSLFNNNIGYLHQNEENLDTNNINKVNDMPIAVSDNSSSFKFLNINKLENGFGSHHHAVECGDRYSDKARDWAQSVDTKIKIAPKIGTLLKTTNIWNYNGLRVENVNAENKKALQKKFAKFGKLKGIETVKNSKSSVWVYYDNPLSPVQAIAHLQGSVVNDISYVRKGSSVPLRLYFAPTNDQTELKFSRPKQPADNKGECYYWRTTSCSLGDKCPLSHIPANKHIDAQIWMKTKETKNI